MSARILIIDDNARWTDYVKGAFPEYEIKNVQDTTGAFEKFGSMDFDLIIVGSRHFGAIEKIKNKHPYQLIAAVTMQPSTEERLRAYRSGAVRYFTKSFSREDIFNKIESLVSKSYSYAETS